MKSIVRKGLWGTAQIIGLSRLEKRLEKLPKRLRTKVIRQALRKGAKISQKEAKRRAPKDTGLLRKEIKVRASKKRKKGSVGVNVIILGDKFDFFYPGVQEYGSETMNIPPVGYMRGAYENTKDDVIKIVTKEIGDGIKRELRSAKKDGKP